MAILDITVDISVAVPTGSLGFGVPLILVSKATEEVPYTKCKNVNEVAAAIKDTGKTSDTCKIAQLIFSQTNAPKEVAIYHSKSGAVSAISEVEEKDWRQLIVAFGESDTDDAEKVSKAVEALDTRKMYFVTVSDTTDLGKLKGNDRTIAFYYDLTKTVTTGEEGSAQTTTVAAHPYAVAALVGETAGRKAGSFTYKNLILKGIEPLSKTSDELAEIHTSGGITFVQKCGDNVTSEGKNTNGQYIDVIDAKDYIQSQIEYRVQKLLNNAPKIPYTNAGISAIESEVVNVLEDAYRNGMINENEGVPDYTTSFQTREEMTEANRSNRVYTGGNFTFKLAGAIHEVEVHGELVI